MGSHRWDVVKRRLHTECLRNLTGAMGFPLWRQISRWEPFSASGDDESRSGSAFSAMLSRSDVRRKFLTSNVTEQGKFLTFSGAAMKVNTTLASDGHTSET